MLFTNISEYCYKKIIVWTFYFNIWGNNFFLNLSEVYNNYFLAPFFCEFLIFSVALCYLIFCSFANTKWWEKTIIFRLFFWIQNFILFLIFIDIFVLLHNAFDFDSGAFFGNTLINNFATVFIKCFILILSYFSISRWFSFIFLNRLSWKFINEFAFIFLSCVFFLIILIALNDFFSVLFIIIALSISLYGLILINLPLFSNTPELGAKYFLLSVVSVGLIFGGIKEIFLVTGHLNFSVIQNTILEKIINCASYLELFSIKYALFFIIAGFLFKLAAAPNHFWAPEIYAGLPYALLLFFAVPVKFVLSFTFFKIIKIVFFILYLNDNVNYILYNESDIFLICAIVFSMIIGGVNAIFEQNMRKFIAYSSINQMGFLLIGLVGFNSHFFCFESFLYFNFVYFINLFIFLLLFVRFSQFLYIPKNVFMNSAIFECWNKEEVLRNKVNQKYSKTFFIFEYFLAEWIKIYTLKIIFVKDISKIKNIRYFVSTSFGYKSIDIIVFVLLVFSLAGVPPFPGFYSKFYILLYAVQLQNWIIFSIGILTSILSVIYYLRLLKIMFFEKQILIAPYFKFNFIDDFYKIAFPFCIESVLRKTVIINTTNSYKKDFTWFYKAINDQKIDNIIKKVQIFFKNLYFEKRFVIIDIFPWVVNNWFIGGAFTCTTSFVLFFLVEEALAQLFYKILQTLLFAIV
jgi:NADH-quinone oxidoreductase subunit N